MENRSYSVSLLKPSMHRHKISKPRGFRFLCVIICANCNRGCLRWLLVVTELGVKEGLDGKESTAALFEGQQSFHRAFLNFDFTMRVVPSVRCMAEP